jgi:cytochrome P450
MSAWFVHHDEAIFPNSHEYIPERWLDNPRLDKYMVSFTKGTRQCVGINLAYAVMYMTTAAIFRRYGGPDSGDSKERLELFETTKDDVVMVADKFVPWVKEGTKGIRVLVKN